MDFYPLKYKDYGGNTMKEAKPVIVTDARLGEGPIWDHERKLLYWLDIVKKELHIYDPLILDEKIIVTDQMIGTVVSRSSGGFVLAMEKGFYFLEESSRETKFIADPESDMPNNRFNDGKCDPAGRFWAGTLNMKGEKNKGSLYCLDTDLKVTKKIEGITTSNGIIWSNDSKAMYYIDTPTREVWAFDYDAVTGDICNRRVAVSIPEGEGSPDGMTIDEEGMIWVAHWGGHRVSRWDPDKGIKLEEIRVGAPKVTACAFGGPHLDILFITTASEGMTEKELSEFPFSGSLFSIKPGVRGVEAQKFLG